MAKLQQPLKQVRRMSSIASLENRCIKEPEKFSEAWTASALLDDKHYNDQHSSNCECDGGGEEKWVWNPVNESRLAFR
jgi:1-phosphatidylinositol-3-phosphate 5-kinase